MIKQDFEKITSALETRINECDKYLADIKTTDDLANKTLRDLSALRDFCKKESLVMTEIIMVDFYHIIGMGNLTAIQEAKFIKQIKKYMSFRTNIKSLASQLNTLSLDDLPEIPAKSKFKLKALCDLTLYSSKAAEEDSNTAFEETANVMDYAAARSEAATIAKAEAEAVKDIEVPKVAIDTQKNIIKINDIEWFLNKVATQVKGIDTADLVNKINSHGSKLGIQFLKGNCAEEPVVGIIMPGSMNTVKSILEMENK